MEKFIKIESLSGVLLFAATIIAVVWANSPFGDSYQAVWGYELGVKMTNFELVKPVILWINDGLMALFFFLIGLEIKRELSVGELNAPKKAIFPLFAAIGGIAFPALVFVLSNNDPEALALIVGKAVGIFLMSNLALRLGISKLPDGVSRMQILGVSFLAGVGFTMSIFIANLAFKDNPALLDSAKVGILIGSLIAGLTGFLLLRTLGKPDKDTAH